MNKHIPEDVIEEIRTRCDIVDLINSYVPLKKAGASWQTCCPFHQEKSPSFKVNPERQIYHCFGCGKGGNVFSFVMEMESVDFPEAARILARKLGVIIPETEQKSSFSSSSSGSIVSRDRLYLIHEKISDFFHRSLFENPSSAVSEYFKTRDIPKDVASQFGIGAAPDSWDAGMRWALSQGFSTAELLDAGLIVERQNSEGYYDRFRNRLMFPICNEQGHVVAFSGRTVEKDFEGGKYVNSPETAIFKKSSILYALHLAKQPIQKKGFAILCEGQLDVIAMHRAGHENTVAPQGTAFTIEQASKIKRFANTLYIAFDSDSAGKKAALRSIDIVIPLGFDVKIVSFPSGKDPDELLRLQGPEAIENAVNSAEGFFDFIFREASSNNDVSTAEGKGRAVEEILSYLTKIQSTVTRSSYITQLAGLLKISESAVFKEMKRLSSNASRYSDRMSFAPTRENAAFSVNVEADNAVGKAEELLLALSLCHGTVGKYLENELPHEMISQTSAGRALEKVIQFTINGEWEFAEKAILDEMNSNPDPAITAILSRHHEYDKEFQEKAMRDCVKAIKINYLKKHIEKIKSTLSAASTPDDKKALLAEFQQCSKDLMNISKA
ncbi:MAG: DNA primase [Lentisphaerae bacterium GWF2_45_14]|nr:MAG: DNA primase [Lentisphaerae bacterium GWF2_45_14]